MAVYSVFVTKQGAPYTTVLRGASGGALPTMSFVHSDGSAFADPPPVADDSGTGFYSFTLVHPGSAVPLVLLVDADPAGAAGLDVGERYIPLVATRDDDAITEARLAELPGIGIDTDQLLLDVADVDADVVLVKADTTQTLLDTTQLLLDVADVDADVVLVKADTTQLLLDVADLDGDVVAVKADTHQLLADVAGVQADTNVLLINLADLDSDVALVKADTVALLALSALIKADTALLMSITGQRNMRITYTSWIVIPGTQERKPVRMTIRAFASAADTEANVSPTEEMEGTATYNTVTGDLVDFKVKGSS